MLLLQEFDIEIRDKPGKKNVVADHLSWLERTDSGLVPINDSFPDESILSISHLPWYANIVNYLVRKILPNEWTKQRKAKFISEAKFCHWDDPLLFKECPDGIWRRCVPQEEMQSILEHCHTRHYGDHHVGKKTAYKALECRFFWPTLFKDSQAYVTACPNCQKTGTMTRRHEMPMMPIQFCEIFDAWGIDFMGPFVNSQGFEYILLAVDYVSRWIEVVAVRKTDAKAVLKFLTDLISRFGHPKILISDGGSHFVNSQVRNFAKKNGIEHRVSTPYHPQTNGLAEVSNREIKSIIQKIVRPDRKD